MVAEHANVPTRYPRPRRTDAGNFGKFPYGKCLRKMVAEHANVPTRYPHRHRTDEGNFGKFRFGKQGHLSPDDLTRIEKSVITALGM